MHKHNSHMDKVYSVEELPCWQQQTSHHSSPALQGISEHADHPALRKPSRFPFSLPLNLKLSLWRGDLCSLRVGAIVHSTNETFTEQNPLNDRLFKIAGPNLIEVVSRLEGCRSGEAKITPAFDLPASNIIHTVGPRYNDKYVTAAENALHSCYRNCLQLMAENQLESIAFSVINLKRRLFPPSNAAHIAIRTVRRFMERYPQYVGRVVFCMDNDDDLELYSNVLPLYFPRTKEEEQLAKVLLPADTGNALGETSIEERKIRIVAFPVTSEEKGETEEEVGEHEVEEEEDSRCYNAEGEDESVDEEFLGYRKEEILALTNMLEDPDKLREEKVEAAEVARSPQDRVYDALWASTESTDLSDISRLNIMYNAGEDARGFPLLVFIGNRMPPNPQLQERVLLYIIQVLHPIATKRDYNVVYLHTNMTKQQQPDLNWLRRLHALFEQKYSQTLRKFYVVHPTFLLKMVVTALTPLLCTKLSRSLQFVESLSGLRPAIDPSFLRLPDDILAVDQKMFGRRFGSSVPSTSSASPTTPTKQSTAAFLSHSGDSRSIGEDGGL
ncbi:Ganglioside-induced differentiation-associated protein 2 [Balamuthia mandrillaris]